MNDIDKENTFIMIVCKKLINLKYLSVKNVKSFAFKIGGSEGITFTSYTYRHVGTIHSVTYIMLSIYLPELHPTISRASINRCCPST